MAFAGDGVDARTPEQTAVAMFAAARGYHRREDKPFWWAHFDRLNNPVDEWGDTQRRLPRREGRGRQGLAPAVVARAEEPALGEAHRHTGGGRTQDRRLRAVRPAVAVRARPTIPTGAPRATPRSSTSNDPNVPTEVTICEREPDDGPYHAAAVRADAPVDRRHQEAARVDRRRGSTGRCGTARAAGHRGRRHPAAPDPAHPQRRAAAAHRRHRRRHHRRTARPRPLVCGRARPAGHRKDATRRRGSSRRW